MLKKAGFKNNLVVTGGLFAVHNAMKKLVEDKVDIYSTSNINYILKMFETNSVQGFNVWYQIVLQNEYS